MITEKQWLEKKATASADKGECYYNVCVIIELENAKYCVSYMNRFLFKELYYKMIISING